MAWQELSQGDRNLHIQLQVTAPPGSPGPDNWPERIDGKDEILDNQKMKLEVTDPQL